MKWILYITIVTLASFGMIYALEGGGGYDPATNSFTHDDGLRYEHTPLGAMRIWDEHNNLIGAQGFALSGTLGGDSNVQGRDRLSTLGLVANKQNS